MGSRVTGLVRVSERVVPSVTVRFCVITSRVSREIARTSTLSHVYTRATLGRVAT